jgi:hypothetical protein
MFIALYWDQGWLISSFSLPGVCRIRHSDVTTIVFKGNPNTDNGGHQGWRLRLVQAKNPGRASLAIGSASSVTLPAIPRDVAPHRVNPPRLVMTRGGCGGDSSSSSSSCPQLRLVRSEPRYYEGKHSQCFSTGGRERLFNNTSTNAMSRPAAPLPRASPKCRVSRRTDSYLIDRRGGNADTKQSATGERSRSSCSCRCRSSCDAACDLLAASSLRDKDGHRPPRA